VFDEIQICFCRNYTIRAEFSQGNHSHHRPPLCTKLTPLSSPYFPLSMATKNAENGKQMSEKFKFEFVPANCSTIFSLNGHALFKSSWLEFLKQGDIFLIHRV
jgi:hypothetical protein